MPAHKPITINYLSDYSHVSINYSDVTKKPIACCLFQDFIIYEHKNKHVITSSFTPYR